LVFLLVLQCNIFRKTSYNWFQSHCVRLLSTIKFEIGRIWSDGEQIRSKSLPWIVSIPFPINITVKFTNKFMVFKGNLLNSFTVYGLPYAFRMSPPMTGFPRTVETLISNVPSHDWIPSNCWNASLTKTVTVHHVQLAGRVIEMRRHSGIR
jgi:hypothetical protein